MIKKNKNWWQKKQKMNQDWIFKKKQNIYVHSSEANRKRLPGSMRIRRGLAATNRSCRNKKMTSAGWWFGQLKHIAVKYLWQNHQPVWWPIWRKKTLPLSVYKLCMNPTGKDMFSTRSKFWLFSKTPKRPPDVVDPAPSILATRSRRACSSTEGTT